MQDKREYLDGLIRSIDSKNAEKFVSYLADDAVFSMGEVPPVTGNENIKNMVAQFFQSIQGLSHTVDSIIEDGNKLVTPGKVTYTRLDGSQLVVNYCNIYDFVDDKIKYYNVYIDLSQLYK